MIFRKGLKDYQLYQTPDGRDAYQYMGDNYVLDMPREKRSAVKLALGIAVVFEALLTYLVGRSGRTAFLKLYAVIPFLFMVFFAGWGLTGAFNLALQQEKMTLNQYTISLKRITYCAIGLSVSAAVTLIAILVHYFTEDGGSVYQAVLTVLLMAVSAGTYLYIHKKTCICILGRDAEK